MLSVWSSIHIASYPEVVILAPRAASAKHGLQLLHPSCPSVATLKDMRKERPNKTIWCGHLFYLVIYFLAFFFFLHLEVPDTLKMLHCRSIQHCAVLVQQTRQEEPVML